MARLLKSTRKADKTLAEIGKRILLEFGETAADQFLKRYQRTVSLMKTQPTAFPIYRDPRTGNLVRKAVIHGRTIVLFDFTDTLVQIQAIHDTRTDWQNP